VPRGQQCPCGCPYVVDAGAWLASARVWRGRRSAAWACLHGRMQQRSHAQWWFSLCAGVPPCLKACMPVPSDLLTPPGAPLLRRHVRQSRSGRALPEDGARGRRGLLGSESVAWLLQAETRACEDLRGRVKVRTQDRVRDTPWRVAARSAMAAPVGPRFGGVRTLGKGAYGFVQLANDKLYGEQVAIKYIPR
jgi:hypothetical protein